VTASRGADVDAARRRSPATSTRPADHDVHVAAEPEEEHQEPFRREARQPAAEQLRDLGLVDAEELDGGGLREPPGPPLKREWRSDRVAAESLQAFAVVLVDTNACGELEAVEAGGVALAPEGAVEARAGVHSGEMTPPGTRQFGRESDFNQG
jgi:hypothetical protein